jgi:hypothetical protein
VIDHFETNDVAIEVDGIDPNRWNEECKRSREEIRNWLLEKASAAEKRGDSEKGSGPEKGMRAWASSTWRLGLW